MRRIAAILGLAAVVGIGAFAIAGGRQPPSNAATAFPAQRLDSASVRRVLAATFGINPAAVVVTEDGAVSARWLSGRLELILFRQTSTGWSATTIAKRSIRAPCEFGDRADGRGLLRGYRSRPTVLRIRTIDR